METTNDGVNMALGGAVRKDRPRNTRQQQEPAKEPAKQPEGDTFKVADHNIDEVKAFVEANPDKVGAVLGAEKRTAEPRSTLIEWLESRKDSDLL